MVSKFTCLNIDCRDHTSLARFWCEVLGYRITETDEHWTEIGPVPDAEEGSSRTVPRLLFVQVPESKTAKNRLHIDINPGDRSQEEEVERLLDLGARRVDVGQGDVSWVVLADPEGNEFCALKSVVA